MAHLGLYLGHFGSGKKPKRLSLNVLNAVPILFKPVPLNRGSHMAILVKIFNLGPCLVFFGPWEGPDMKNDSCSRWNRGQCTYWDQKKTIGDDNGALSLNAYHLYRWYLTVAILVLLMAFFVL